MTTVMWRNAREVRRARQRDELSHVSRRSEDALSWARTPRTHQRMAQHRVNDQWQSDGERDGPIREGRELFPKRQLLSVVDIKGDQHEGVGSAHADNMQPDPLLPAPTKRSSPQPG